MATLSTDLALAPPAYNNENTNNPLLAVASSAIVLPDCSQSVEEEGLENFTEANQRVLAFGQSVLIVSDNTVDVDDNWLTKEDVQNFWSIIGDKGATLVSDQTVKLCVTHEEFKSGKEALRLQLLGMRKSQ